MSLYLIVNGLKVYMRFDFGSLPSKRSTDILKLSLLGIIKAGTYLSSRVVTNQVFSAQLSLTSVFGMGTGGS